MCCYTVGGKTVRNLETGVTAGLETPEQKGAAEARLAAADYIADLSGSLASLARLHGLETLSYMLEMARLEAQQTREPV